MKQILTIILLLAATTLMAQTLYIQAGLDVRIRWCGFVNRTF